MNTFSVLVLGYDPYSDCWPLFVNFYEKQPFDAPCFFVSSKTPVNGSRAIQSILTKGDMSFSGRVNAGLAKIDSPYTMVLMEDYLLYRKPDDETVQSLIEEMTKLDADFVLLDDFKARVKAHRFKDSNILKYTIDKSSKYLFSLRPSIWKTEVLRNICKNEIQRPWDFESSSWPGNKNRGFAESLSLYFVGKGRFEFLNLLNKGKIDYGCYRVLKKEKIDVLDWPIQSASEYRKCAFRRFIAGILSSFIRVKLSKNSKF